ncbi:MAG: hypothetical protein IID18_10245 [Nitrospinae bacterium]|nr:hypothetical protein [Nitrospinota bacterium]
MICVSIVTLGYLGILLWVEVAGSNGSSNNLSEVIGRSVVRIAILSVLYYAIVFCGRSYRASMHNHMMNRHRYRSLDTFAVFLASAEQDPVTKKELLKLVARAIFDSQATGFLQGDKSDPALVNVVHAGE